MAFEKRGTPQLAEVLNKCAKCKNIFPVSKLKDGLCKECRQEKKNK